MCEKEDIEAKSLPCTIIWFCEKVDLLRHWFDTAAIPIDYLGQETDSRKKRLFLTPFSGEGSDVA
jgi:hypothetical protein